jgi:hypothetical protein
MFAFPTPQWLLSGITTYRPAPTSSSRPQSPPRYTHLTSGKCSITADKPEIISISTRIKYLRTFCSVGIGTFSYLVASRTDLSDFSVKDPATSDDYQPTQRPGLTCCSLGFEMPVSIYFTSLFELTFRTWHRSYRSTLFQIITQEIHSNYRMRYALCLPHLSLS